jgi:glycosyltransferase involved in cell wall biosynthesis
VRAALAIGRIRESPPAARLRDIRERRRRVEWPQGAPRSTNGDRVAVVIVNHNTRGLVSQLVFSLYRVLGRDQFATIVVVDNASTDGSLAVLQALMDAKLIHLIANKRRRYHGSGLNQAVSWLASRQSRLREPDRIDYVWALDSDTMILRRDTVRDALDVFRRLRPAAIGESFGERDGYEYLLPATLMFEPGLVWRRPVSPFADDGNPERKFLETATDAGYRLLAHPFLHHSYVLHLGSGTMIEIADREQGNRFHVWAKRDLAGRRHYTYIDHPLGQQLHAEVRRAYEREIPDGTPQQLVRTCMRDELIAIPCARPLPPKAVLRRLYDEGEDLVAYVLAEWDRSDQLSLRPERFS